MYQINPNEPFTLDKLRDVLQQFQTRDLPRLNVYRKYYEGKQEIISKKPSDTGKPCNIVVTNYCDNIVHNFLGYITGKPITYSSDEQLNAVMDVLNYNDVQQEDSEYLRTALIYGVAYEINYIDEEGKQRFRLLDPRNVVPIYDNTLNNNLLYVVRCWVEVNLEEEEEYIVEVYSNTDVKRYRSVPGFSSFMLLDQYQHFFNQVPITVFKLNEDQVSSYDQVMTLQDAYNKLQSAEIDDFESFCDSYMLLSGAIADDDQLADMKKKRVLMLPEGSTASYLTKSVSDTQIQNILTNIKQQIHMIANSPDFTDEKFMAQSGVAIRYKLIGFENTASQIEAEMKKALQRRIELICSILKLTNDEMIWRDIEINFTRNLPTDISDTVSMVTQLKGIVSNETLLAQIPFVKDVDEELARVKKETEENMELYSFQTGEVNAGEDEEEEQQ